jgi:hypothetical protein
VNNNVYKSVTLGLATLVTGTRTYITNLVCLLQGDLPNCDASHWALDIIGKLSMKMILKILELKCNRY